MNGVLRPLGIRRRLYRLRKKRLIDCNFSQGLKPRVLFGGVYGTTEVVP